MFKWFVTKRNILFSLLCLFLCVMIGYALLVSVYCIPVESMREETESSIATMSSEGVYVLGDSGEYLLDNYTDSWMLLTAIYDGNESPFAKAANSPSRSINDPYSSYLYTLSIEYNDNSFINNYYRYWH